MTSWSTPWRAYFRIHGHITPRQYPLTVEASYLPESVCSLLVELGVLGSVTNEVGEGERDVLPLVMLILRGSMLMGRRGDALGEMCWDIRSPSSVASR